MLRAAYDLAARLNRPDAEAMLADMSSVQFLRWRVWMAANPSAEEMSPYLSAQVAAAIWNVQIAKGTKKDEEPKFRPFSDFLLQFGDMPKPAPGPTKQQSEKSKWEKITSFVQSFGRKDQ